MEALQKERRYTYADYLSWENGGLTVNAYEHTDTAPVHVLEGCVIRLADVFAEIQGAAP